MSDKTQEMLAEILEIVKRIEANATTVPNSPVVGSVESSVPAQKKMSIGEFLREHAPSSKTETVLAVAFFLEKFEQVSPFNASDLKRAFRAAKEVPPANVNDTANWCVKNRHMMEDSEKKDSMKAWVLTRTGEEYVESHFGRINETK